MQTNCSDFDIIHQNFYTAFNLKDIFHNFHNVHPQRIISFTIHTVILTNKQTVNYLRRDIAAICMLKMP